MSIPRCPEAGKLRYIEGQYRHEPRGRKEGRKGVRDGGGYGGDDDG